MQRFGPIRMRGTPGAVCPPPHFPSWLLCSQALACCPGHPSLLAVQTGQELGVPFPSAPANNHSDEEVGWAFSLRSHRVVSCQRRWDGKAQATAWIGQPATFLVPHIRIGLHSASCPSLVMTTWNWPFYLSCPDMWHWSINVRTLRRVPIPIHASLPSW